ncbi:fimbria/pilus outer membrane usher protein [Erwinia sp. 9145]|uniref:fimbria/pilus outer membrane usher protein n=1 Tax=Erwinia sp. 9145 TaxID=1500895 RepID=UPI0018CDFD06|nr:fimbria/pilus outer membrane usher protein [Erwinia sp. 9145]
MKKTYSINNSKIALFVSSVILMSFFLHRPAYSEVQFNPDFISTMTGTNVDISRFNGAYKLYPGVYDPDIYINGRFIGRNKVVVREVGNVSVICIDKHLIETIKIKQQKLEEEGKMLSADENSCSAMRDLIPQSEAKLNLADMRLDFSIPQAYLERQARGYVSPALWSHGVNGAFTNYTTSFFEQHNGNEVNRSFYGDIRAGLNLGPWFLRHAGSFRWNEHRDREYNVFSTTLQRDITPISSRLLLGDANTSGEIFDSFSFRGLQLATADQMLPDSMRGYAPTIRGIARTNARVTVRQRGNVIYETTVPAGEFIINDLYPTGYGGDLDVEVTEADGSVSTFAVPYSSLAHLLRPGLSNYSVIAGKLRNLNVSSAPWVAQMTYKRGLNNLLTVYTGLTGTENWRSAVIGSAIGTPVGAFSFDVTSANFRYKDENKNGASVRASYSKFISATSSSISLAAYRFSSSGYVDLYNSVYLKDHLDSDNETMSFNNLNRPKNRYSLTVSQLLSDELGQFYISGFRENYWNKSQTNTQYQFGYNNSYKMLSYGLAVNKNITLAGAETQYMLNLSLPLGKNASVHSYTTFNKEGSNSQIGISGIAGDRDQLTYGSSISKDVNNNYSTDLSGTWTRPETTMSGSYSRGKSYYAFSGGLSGSVVGFSEGIVLSPYNNLDTMAVVSAEHAAGATIDGYSGIVLDHKGHAIVPYLNPYRLNQVSLNPKGLSYDVEIENSIQQVAPYHGAIVKIDYPTRHGRMLLIRAQLPDGNALPFGATVKKRNGEEAGIVAQGGQIYVRLDNTSDYLSVRWGEEKQQTCGFEVSISDKPVDNKSRKFERLNRVCQPQTPGGVSDTSSAVASLATTLSSSQ